MWHSLKKLREVLIFVKVTAPRGIRKTGGKTWLTYEERLKRTEMMIRKSNERINDGINNDIDHNNGVII